MKTMQLVAYLARRSIGLVWHPYPRMGMRWFQVAEHCLTTGHQSGRPGVYTKHSLRVHKSQSVCDYAPCVGKNVSLFGYWTFYTHQLGVVWVYRTTTPCHFAHRNICAVFPVCTSLNAARHYVVYADFNHQLYNPEIWFRVCIKCSSSTMKY